MSSLKQAREDLAAAFRLAVREGFNEGICNHFSLMVPDDPNRFLINAHGLHWSEITASNLLVVDDGGVVVEGDGEVEPTARYIHWRAHRSAPHAACVLHTHMPYATTLCSLRDKTLPVINQNALRFVNRIAYDDEYNGVALDEEEGDRLAKKLMDKAVLMMGNHGVMVVGPSVAEAWNDLYYLERACRTVVLAMSTGRELDPIPSQLVQRGAQQIAEEQGFSELHFQALRRLLDKQQPDYAA